MSQMPSPSRSIAVAATDAEVELVAVAVACRDAGAASRRWRQVRCNAAVVVGTDAVIHIVAEVPIEVSRKSPPQTPRASCRRSRSRRQGYWRNRRNGLPLDAAVVIAPDTASTSSQRPSPSRSAVQLPPQAEGIVGQVIRRHRWRRGEVAGSISAPVADAVTVKVRSCRRCRGRRVDCH